MGFANVQSHMLCRLSNPSLLCSSDPRYITNMAFDSIVNTKLNGKDTRLVKRGFDELLGKNEGSSIDNCSSLFLDDKMLYLKS